MKKLSLSKESTLADKAAESGVLPEFDYRTITSYEAACERNQENPITDWGDKPKKEIAYVKLKAIVKALNNDPGFPRFTVGESRFDILFLLCSKDKYDKMDDEWKTRVVVQSYSHSNANDDSSGTGTGCGSQLVFKNRELTIFCGKTFIDLWYDFIFIHE